MYQFEGHLFVDPERMRVNSHRATHTVSLIKTPDRMKSVSIFVVLILVGIALARANSSDARSRSHAPHQTVTQKPVVQIAGEANGEVDRLLKRLKRKHEIVMGVGPELTSPEAESGRVDRISYGTPLHNSIVPRPEYSLIARAAHASGPVVVEIVFDETGRVIAAQAVSGHPLLIPAAMKAARESRRTPVSINGKLVKSFGILTYNFSL
jgi:hypothetical protein